MMAQHSSPSDEPVVKKFAPGGWDDLAETAVQITSADDTDALPAGESAPSEEAAAPPIPESGSNTPAPEHDSAAQSQDEAPLQGGGPPEPAAKPPGTGEARGQAAFVTLTDTESEDLFQTVYDEQLDQPPPPSEQGGVAGAEAAGPAQPEQASGLSEEQTVVFDSAADTVIKQPDVPPVVVRPDPAGEAGPPAAEPGSQPAPAPATSAARSTARRLVSGIRLVSAARQALCGLRWSGLGRLAQLSLVALASVMAGVVLAALIMAFASRADQWQAAYLATLSDGKLFKYMAKLEEGAGSPDYPAKRQELDKELQRRVSAYAEEYWKKIGPQYQQCSRIADQSLQAAWQLLAQKHADLLDTMALLVEEEILFFGSFGQARLGSLLIGDGMLLDGRIATLRSISPGSWRDLKLDQVAAVPAQDWLCLRCKVMRERESIPVLQGRAGRRYHECASAVRRKSSAFKLQRASATH